MANLTRSIKIIESATNSARYVRRFTVKNGATIYAGALVCVEKSSGKALPYSDASGLTSVVGIALNEAAGGKSVDAQSGCFVIDNAAANGLTSSHLNTKVYAADDHTVTSAAGTNAVVAGVLRFFDPQTNKPVVEIGNFFA